ncbi:MAG TPA: DNA methyltransferase [Polyangiaceae bacterium]|nr:DNA methyltransferase [Polyangiaceae bacterium]
MKTALSASVTFRGNLRTTRHGWLRLTPAYSVQLVRELLSARSRPDLPVLDPFCGTGTTLLTCAELGIDCRTVDINPFLRWLAQAKSRRYAGADIVKASKLIDEMAAAARRGRGSAWVPALHHIEKWWDERTLSALSRAFAVIAKRSGKARDLATLAFCRALVDAGNVSFAHQSMSFRSRAAVPDVAAVLTNAFEVLRASAAQPLGAEQAEVLLGDSRQLPEMIQEKSCGAVVTSPPYVNRMSYIRELRPYMYWLGFLDDGRAAGELDWRAIGGTWGIATSKLSRWQAPAPLELPGLRAIVRQIEATSPVLARYVERYFCDMDEHVRGLVHVLAHGARAHYVVGNSKFFDVMVPAERFFAQLFRRHGLVKVKTRVLRRRTSKKELFEYLVSAERA